MTKFILEEVITASTSMSKEERETIFFYGKSIDQLDEVIQKTNDPQFAKLTQKEKLAYISFIYYMARLRESLAKFNIRNEKLEWCYQITNQLGLLAAPKLSRSIGMFSSDHHKFQQDDLLNLFRYLSNLESLNQHGFSAIIPPESARRPPRKK